MRYATKLEADVKRRIATDLAKHQITQIHAKGVYGHWKCQEPGTWINGFNIVTWPGSLCYTGDMGEYLFQKRGTDMIAFMRGSAMSYSYAAEKCTAHGRDEISEFRKEVFNEILEDELREYPDSKEKIDDIRASYSCHDENPYIARQAMYESNLWDCEVPDCEEYTFHFLFALHAIKWFCDKVERKEPFKTKIIRALPFKIWS